MVKISIVSRVFPSYTIGDNWMMQLAQVIKDSGFKGKISMDSFFLKKDGAVHIDLEANECVPNIEKILARFEEDHPLSFD